MTVSLDDIVTIPVTDLGRQLGFLRPDQERALAIAIANAFDLESAQGWSREEQSARGWSR